jgi:hypothetical protein
MTVSSTEVFEGWARLCATENNNLKEMPSWVSQAIHPDCERPTHTWAMLVGIQRERKALFCGERLPREVLGFPTASMDAAILYLERQSNFFAAALAWGSYDDEWV